MATRRRVVKKPSALRVFLIDLGERTGATFGQAFLSVVIVAGGKVVWIDAVFTGLFAAAITVLSTGVQWLISHKPISNAYIDLGYRTGLTFGQTLLGAMAAAGTVSALAFHWTAALSAAAVAAGTALLKGLIGLNSIKTLGASAVNLNRTFSPR